MASYAWRVTNGDQGVIADWTNTTTSQNPATTLPGTADSVNFNTTGGTVTGAATVDQFNVNAGATALWTFNGKITAGAAYVSSATALTVGGSIVLSGKPSGTPLPSAGVIGSALTLTGATLDASQGTLFVGASNGPAQSGTAALTIQGGSTATALVLSIGSGKTGTVTVDGTGSTLSTIAGRVPNTGAALGGYLIVGAPQTTSGVTSNGSGTLTVSNGGVVTASAPADTTRSYLSIAASAGTTGAVTVSGTGSLLDVGPNAASIGDGGTGSLMISAGGSVRSAAADPFAHAALRLGQASGSSGTLTITGAGSTFVALGYVFVGRAGAATLALDQGGALIGGQTTPSLSSDFGIAIGDGTPAIDGETGAANTPLYFGGTGTATVTNGSTLTSFRNLYVGNRGSTGTLTVDTSSKVVAGDEIMVGAGPDRAGGNGTVTIQGHGTVTAGGRHLLANAGITIGADMGTTGAVTVSGYGSTLNANNDRIAVGSRGNGSLTVSGGGSVFAGAQYADTEAALTVGAAPGGIGTVLVTDSMLEANGEAVLGGTDVGAGPVAGGTGTVSLTGSAQFYATSLAMFTGSSFTNTTASAVIGPTFSAGTSGALTVDAGATVSGAGAIHANVIATGTITAKGGTLSIDAVAGGAGTLAATTGSTLHVGRLNLGNPLGAPLTPSPTLLFSGPAATISIGMPGGTSTVVGFGADDTLDITNTDVISIVGNVVIDTATVLTSRTTLDSTTAQSPPLASSTANGTRTSTLVLAGLDPTTTLTLASDGAGGTKIVGGNALFDGAYYLANNPDVAAAGVDPYLHYITTGWKEGRNPSALLNTNYYLAHNPDVAAAGINPLLHFEASGWKENRDPSAAFSLHEYLLANPDVKAAGLDPLLHYVASGRAEGRAAFAVPTHAPDPAIDAAYYWAHNPDVKAAGLDPTDHYLASGWKEGRDPNAFFDTNYYLTQNPDVKAAGLDPLLHFEASGYKEGRAPSLLFDDAKYLQANTDVAAAHLNPLLHYLASGQFEGRISFLTGGTLPADPLVNTAYYDAQLGATLIPTGTPGAQQAAWSYDTSGWQKGLNPDAYFNTTYYLSHNPDVAAAHVDPLLHYETNGWKEGRDPSAQFSTTKYLAAYADVKAAGLDPLLHYVQFGQAEGRSAFTA